MLTLNSSADFSMSITVIEDPIATAKQVNATTMVRSLKRYEKGEGVESA